MLLAIDAYYIDNSAKTVGVLFENWQDAAPWQILTAYKDDVEPYQSGQFYQRELPCIIELLKQVDLSTLDAIIIDGYVYLDNEGKIGLGGYLYNHLEQKIPVIGVAKKPFHNNTDYVAEVLRGKSKQPLYVTAAGLPLADAAESIRTMHGPHRMPTLLTVLDQQTKLFKFERD